jgi:Fe-S cluster biogenesis protein NfuA
MIGIPLPEPRRAGRAPSLSVERPNPNDTLEERVGEAVRRLGAALAADGGTIEVESVGHDGRVSVRLGGACIGCPLRPLTMAWLVRPVLLDIAGVGDVVLTGLALSEFAEARIQRMYSAYHREPGSAT